MYGDQIYILYETIYADRSDLSSAKDIVKHVTFSKRFAKRWSVRWPNRFYEERKVTRNDQALNSHIQKCVEEKKERIKKQQSKAQQKRAKQRKLEREKEEKKQNKHIGSKFEDFFVEECLVTESDVLISSEDNYRD